MKSERSATRRSLRRHILIGVMAVSILVTGVFGWAVAFELSGAVIAQGVLVVDTNVKKVQHPSGGVVGELLVRDGDRVERGDVLLRLDDTVTRANLAIILKSLDELAARHARLEAERDDLSEPEFPQDLTARDNEPDVARILKGEKRLFEFRRSARSGQKAQLTERIAQLKQEIQGLYGQATAKRSEIALMQRELEGVRHLWKLNLVPISKVTVLEREAVRLEGDQNQLMAAAAQARGKITETELQIIQIEQDLRSEVSREIREIQAKSAELVERKVAAEDQLKRVDIRSPQSGFVHQLAVHTVGGVVTPSEALMLIVPENDRLTIDARVPPEGIDQVHLGQAAALRFTAFNQRTTPEFIGSVSRVAADLTQDPSLNLSYYLVRVSLPSEILSKSAEFQLLPGMPVEVHLQTDSRSVLSYLFKPLRDQAMKAFRER